MMRRFRCSVSDDDIEVDESSSELPSSPNILPTINEGVQKITICVLGAPKVGKTAIIGQFIDNKAINHAVDGILGHRSYTTSIVINGGLYELNIIECPASIIGGSPRPNNEHCMNIHKADAHVLVYDVTNKSSLQYITSLARKLNTRRNIQNSFEGGNYDDFIHKTNSTNDIPSTTTTSSSIDQSTSSYKQPIVIVGNKYDLPQTIHMKKFERAAFLSQMPDLYPLVESSAKHNWHVLEVFKEVMKVVNYRECRLHEPGNGSKSRKERMNQCTIL